VYERRADALGTARFLIGGYRNVSIDPSMRQSTRGGAPSSLMAKAIYGHIGKALFHRPTSWRIHGGSVGRTKPPARPPLASQPVFRLNATLNLDCLIWTAASPKISRGYSPHPQIRPPRHDFQTHSDFPSNAFSRTSQRLWACTKWRGDTDRRT
jgi:hypothetical protein